MENFISESFLKTLRSNFLVESERFYREAEKLKKETDYGSKTRVFISHKHSDKELLKSFVLLLKQLEVDVYLDWMDYDMPKNTDGFTARRIKQKIRELDKFILFATEDAIGSKWCNWELGFGDAIKFPQNLAIMPIIKDYDSKWSGTEYLQIYPILTSEMKYNIGSYYVEYEGQVIDFKNWLKK